MKYKPHFNPTFGRWKTAPYGRNPNERTQMEKMSEMWKAFHRRVSALLGLRRKAHKGKKIEGEKISPGTKATDRLRAQLHRRNRR